jgi:hypothetical protein
MNMWTAFTSSRLFEDTANSSHATYNVKPEPRCSSTHARATQHREIRDLMFSLRVVCDDMQA